MSLPALCAGCSLGHHDKHDGEHHGAPGLIGGTYCPCTGDCKPPDLSEIFPVSAGTSEGRCEHGQTSPHSMESGIEPGVLPTIDCPGPMSEGRGGVPGRLTDEELAEAVKQRLRAILDQNPYFGDWDEWAPIAYDRIPVVARAAMSHLYGRHDDSEVGYAHCVLCQFVEAEVAAVRGQGEALQRVRDWAETLWDGEGMEPEVYRSFFAALDGETHDA